MIQNLCLRNSLQIYCLLNQFKSATPHKPQKQQWKWQETLQKWKSIHFNNNGLKMPKYSQVTLALETSALIPQGNPPFQCLTWSPYQRKDGMKTENKREKKKRDDRTSPLHNHLLSLSKFLWVTELCKCFKEYWEDMRYSRFSFVTEGCFVLGSSWEVSIPKKHYYSNCIIS